MSGFLVQVWRAFCRAVIFRLVSPSVDFVAFGGTIYVRPGVTLRAHNRAHEETHLDRQRQVGQWRWLWRYMTDKDFKLKEELAAFRAEIEAGGDIDFCAHYLSSGVYGFNLTEDEARRLLQK